MYISTCVCVCVCVCECIQYRESEQVVIQDRVEKENLRRRREYEELQKHAATKVTIQHPII